MADIKNELNNLLSKIIHAIIIIFIHFLGMNHEAFKFRYGWHSKEFGICWSSHAIVCG